MKIRKNMGATLLKLTVLTAIAAGFATPLFAFDPMDGADQPPVAQPTARFQTYAPTDGSRYARGQGLPSSVVPHRYYASPAQVAQGSAPAYNQPVASTTAYIPPAPNKAAQVFVPAGQESIYNNPAPYSPPVAPVAAGAPIVAAQANIAPPPPMPAAPAANPIDAAYAPAPTSYAALPADGEAIMAPVANSSSTRFYIGMEGFYDRYQEESVDLDNRAVYGAVDVGFNYYFNPSWFGGSELRVSYGKNDYESPSGTIDGVDQWEFEHRITGGYDFAMPGNRHVRTIMGINTRYFRDEGKGEVTNLGANAYDRRILQVFIPLGVAYEFPAWGYHFTPSVEYDHLIYGRVESRLQNVPGYFQATNYQKSGYGLRAEFMARKVDASGTGWEFGPFVRYWHFNNSDIDTTAPTPSGSSWLEPDNNRLQVGAKVKWLF